MNVKNTRCCGYLINLKRCQRTGNWKFLFDDHKRQPCVWMSFFVFTVCAGIASIYTAVTAQTTEKDMVVSHVSTGIASINYQCRQTEKPCPEFTELKRRAIRVAKMHALEDLSIKTGIEVNSLATVAHGQFVKDIIKTKSGEIVKGVEFQDPVITGDQVSVKAIIRSQ